MDRLSGMAKKYSWFRLPCIDSDDAMLVEMSPNQWRLENKYSPVYIDELLCGIRVSWDLYVHLCVFESRSEC